MSEQKIKQSFNEAWISLINTVKSAYTLAPFVVIVFACVVLIVSYISISSSKLMMGVVLLLVLGITIVIYAATNNFGEAALALVAGLLTAYSVTWTPAKFIGFITVWSAFSICALLISSIKLASRSEEIYKQAAIAICNRSSEVPVMEKELKKISKECPNEGLGPIERAETILIFAYKKLPIELQSNALKAVSILSIITQIPPKKISSFIADTYKVFNFSAPHEQKKLVDILYDNIKESPVPPDDFIDAFNNSRRLIVSGKIDPYKYLKLLKKALESGAASNEVCDFLMKEIDKEKIV